MEDSVSNRIFSASHKSPRSRPFEATSLAIALICPLIVSCSPSITNGDIPTRLESVESSSPKTHVAFAGGGWRAHTGHSGWVMSLLKANQSNCALSTHTSGNPKCLKAAFANVETISGNSGGSWFSSMLMYDPDFVNQITDANASQTWGSTDPTEKNQGWLGKQQGYFASFRPECGGHHGDKYVGCILLEYFPSDESDLAPNWNKLVLDLVYKGYDWQSYGTLGAGARQPWAEDKALLMAGTLLTNGVVLNDQNLLGEEYFYQVCLGPNKAKSDGDDGSWCVDTNGNKIPRSAAAPDVLPITFASLPKKSFNLKAPSFIARQGGIFDLGYAEAYTTIGPAQKTNSINSGINKTANIPVVEAAAASSAAVGYAASYPVTGSGIWDVSFHARNLAIGFKLPNDGQNQVAYLDDAKLYGLSLDKLNKERVFRVADGGAVDNSGIAQLVSYLQLNDKADNFNIVAFDDIQKNDAGKGNYPSSDFPSSDISYMFNGAPKEGVCVEQHCVQVPELKILKPNPRKPDPIAKYTWTIKGKNATNYLHYFTYEVETLSNPSFNITNGSTGTVHVFATQFGCADTQPENNKITDFACYNELLTSIISDMQRLPDNHTSGKTGYEILSEAFGLSVK